MSLVSYFLNGNLIRIRREINSVNVNDVIDDTNHTALHYAIKCKNLDIIKYLISIGADPNRENIFKENCIKYAMLYQISEFHNLLQDQNTRSLKRKIDVLENENDTLEDTITRISKKYKTDEDLFKNKIVVLQKEIEKKNKQIDFFKQSHDSRKKN